MASAEGRGCPAIIGKVRDISMIGIYNYTVILTYLSIISAGVGMFIASGGNIKLAIFFFMFSGLCDMIDGPVARTCKTRTETAKKFGIQIDSLCDCISFGVQPAMLIYFIAHFNCGDASWLEIAALVAGILLVLCGVIRLAFFNVSEEERQNTEGAKPRTSYRGLPVTNVAWIVPLGYLSRFFTEGAVFAGIMVGVELLTAFLFVLDFKFPKLHGKKLIPVFFGCVLLFVGVCFA